MTVDPNSPIVISVSFVASVVTIISIFGNPLNWLANKTKTAEISNYITLDYWRLFGPSVPKVMELIEHDPKITKQDENHVYFEMNGAKGVVEQDLWRTYCKLVHHRRISVSGRLLWTKYSSKKQMGKLVDFLVKPALDCEVVRWMEDNYIDQSFDIELPEYAPREDNWRGNHTNDVGFLFLNVANNGNKVIHKVELNFSKSVVAEHLPKYEVPGRTNYADIFQKFAAKGNPDSYLTDAAKDLIFFEDEVVRIPAFKPGEEWLFLVAVYRSDYFGFEVGYVDDVFKVTKIEGVVDRHKVKFEVRPPNREKSVVEKVPYGWFRQ